MALGRAAILGARGMLGAELEAALRREAGCCEILCGDLPEADITDSQKLRQFLKAFKPGIVFNCAAMTNVDGCEAKQGAAFAVNADGAGNAAEVAKELDALIVHVSTDYVFNGSKRVPYTEDDKPEPLSVYGKSKAAGERMVAERGGRWIIARTAWLYGRARMNFVDQMLRLGVSGKAVSVIDDQVSSPTWARELAEGLVALLKSEAEGIFHVTNAGECSRYEQIQWAFDCAGIKGQLRPAKSAEFPRAAPVPVYSALSVEKLARETGHVMRSWKDALREYVLKDSPITKRLK